MMGESKKNVPKRRFKEFENAKAWEQHKLGNLADIVRGASPRPIQDPKWFDDKSIVGWLRISDVSDQDGRIHYLEQHISKAGQGKTRVLMQSHLLLSIAASVGKPVINYISTGVHDGFLIFQNPTFDREFMFQWMKMFEGQWQKYGQPGSQVNLNSDIVKNQVIIIPKEKEQIKIGTFFFDLDNLITLHQRKLEKIKALKKAYLTEMFPAEGERKPKLRFAGFTDDWKQRKVKEVCSISTGKSNTQDHIDDGIYPFYVRSAIIEHSNRYLYDEEAVLTVGDGVGTGKVFHYVNGKYDLHQRVYRMFGFINGISGKYFYYYFSNHFYDRVMSMTAKTSVDSVRFEMISEMDIMLPTEKEQTVITGFFDILDNLIAFHERKLEKLQNIKKAYLNEMFI